MANERQTYYVDLAYDDKEIWSCKARSASEARAMYHNLCSSKKGFSRLEEEVSGNPPIGYTKWVGLYKGQYPFFRFY